MPGKARLRRKGFVEKHTLSSGEGAGHRGWSNEEPLFVQGLSSRAEVTELSGRGVGMSALQHGCQAEG
jgi:chemotaxis protein histidine kinase CheA